MRERIFAKQKFTDEFEAVGGLFYGQCAEYCGNSHAYMSFRALAQTDEDFDSWVKRFQNAQNPNLQPGILRPGGRIPERFDSPIRGSMRLVIPAHREYRAVRSNRDRTSSQSRQGGVGKSPF